MMFERWQLLVAVALTAHCALGCEVPQDPAKEPDSEAVAPEEKEPADAEETRALIVKEIKRLHKSALEKQEGGDWSEARRLALQGIEMAKKCGHKCELDRAKFFLIRGNAAREAGLETDARRFYADAMAIFHVHKYTRGRFETFLSVGQLEARQGDYSAANRQLDQAKALLPQIEDKKLIGQLNVQAGRLASRRQEREQALLSFQEAVRLFDVADDKIQVAETLLLLAAEEDSLGKSGACRNTLDRALRIFQSHEDLDGEVRVVHRLAALAERDKKYAQAKKLLKRVLELYKKLDRTSAATKVERHINALPE